MRLNRLVLVATTTAVICSVAVSCGSGGGKSSEAPPAAAAPAAAPAADPTAGSRPSPPPPIEIAPGEDLRIAWKVDGNLLNKAEAEPTLEISDDYTWKVTTLVVTDEGGTPHSDVVWVSIKGKGTDRAMIRKIGSQIYWQVKGDYVPVCSKYDTGIPQCSGNGIPDYLFDFEDFSMQAEWRNTDGTTKKDKIKKIELQTRTCPPY
jgi:hypothetical protein